MQTRTLSKEQTDEMNKLRLLTQFELFVLAEHCVVPKDDVSWDPRNNLAQNHLLLEAVIREGDCELFFDDGADQYFIYQWDHDSDIGKKIIAHRPNLNEAVLEAAMVLWLPIAE